MLLSPMDLALAISLTATIAATADGETGLPFSSITKQRSASPSKASPISAFSDKTFFCRSTRFLGSRGFASWFGKVPSSSKYIGIISIGNFAKPAFVPSTAGAVRPPIPLAASMTTLRGFIFSSDTNWRKLLA